MGECRQHLGVEARVMGRDEGCAGEVRGDMPSDYTERLRVVRLRFPDAMQRGEPEPRALGRPQKPSANRAYATLTYTDHRDGAGCLRMDVRGLEVERRERETRRQVSVGDSHRNDSTISNLLLTLGIRRADRLLQLRHCGQHLVPQLDRLDAHDRVGVAQQLPRELAPRSIRD